ncbi:response regulator transcription factor [Alphaproteobacteria bacterium]|nr:response regulator transcription factor [Alphaproteobacteria bacterium]
MNRVLVVDDDPHIREVVQFALDKEGFSTVEAKDGAEALEQFAAEKPDLIVLDITMPELDGTEVCRRIRQNDKTPIIFLSSRDDEIDRVLGLELGGDDYITKPFSPRELVARVKAVLRRLDDSQEIREQEGTATMQHGRLSLNLDDFTGQWDDTQVVLTLTEFGILRTLMQRPGKVYSRDDLMSSAYELSRIVSDRTIDSHVRRVRKKFADIGSEPVETVHGIGYKLGSC